MAPKKANTGQTGGDGFTFLVTTNPLSSSAAHKKKIRSAAAVSSWPERRKRTFEQFESSSKPGQTLFEAAPQYTGRLHGPQSTQDVTYEYLPSVSPGESLAMAMQRQARGENSPHTEAFNQEIIQHLRPSHQEAWQLITPTSETDGPILLADSQFCSRESTPDSPCQCVQCDPQLHLARAQTIRSILVPSTRKRTGNGNIKWLSNPFTPPPTPPVTNMADPFNCYPVPYKRLYDKLLHHMLTVYAPRGWPALRITRLLFASGDLIQLRALQPEASYWLRAQAVRAINEALQDPRRATSDALILAVGRIALNESMYGDRDAANTIHRPAQQRMIQMRGGLRALDFPDLVKRLMRWSDTVMSKQGGTQRFLEDEDELQNFSMDESVNVLEKWVPQQGQALRKKIRISDLVNN